MAETKKELFSDIGLGFFAHPKTGALTTQD